VDLAVIVDLVLPIVGLGVVLLFIARAARARAARLQSKGQTVAETAVRGPSSGLAQYVEVLFVGPQPKFVALIGKLLAGLVILFVLGVLLWIGVSIVRAI
jgi:hypothetical protein